MYYFCFTQPCFIYLRVDARLAKDLIYSIFFSYYGGSENFIFDKN